MVLLKKLFSGRIGMRVRCGMSYNVCLLKGTKIGLQHPWRFPFRRFIEYAVPLSGLICGRKLKGTSN